jgi:hypothetical protein
MIGKKKKMARVTRRSGKLALELQASIRGALYRWMRFNQILETTWKAPRNSFNKPRLGQRECQKRFKKLFW